ncbi:TlpA family protein disulfide reductase [bacterium]|nr:TlpA family protein disulfide reductase [bacterium]
MYKYFAVLVASLLLVQIPTAIGDDDDKYDIFPAFELEDIEGNTIVFEELLGKGPIAITFWATWCKPCLKEMDKIQPFYEEYKDRGLEVVAISEDGPRTKKKVPSLIKRKGYSFIVVYDDNKSLQYTLGFADIPELFLVNEKGEIVYHHFGYKAGDESELKEKILEILPEEMDSTKDSGSLMEAQSKDEQCE